MKLEQQVTSKEISQRLKELGVKQESLFYWTNTDELLFQPLMPNRYVECSAFTVAELGEMLPHRKKWNENQTGKWSNDWMLHERLTLSVHGSHYILFYQGDNDEIFHWSDEWEANARGKMLIFLLENNLITL